MSDNCCDQQQSNSCCSGAINNSNKSCCSANISCNGSDVIPRISTTLTKKDIFGAWKARWGINRNNYKVDPGLYAVGEPDSNSPVLVSANYKLTFDTLRKNLSGLNCWLLILDTKGVNVWCAAGKGTFGTDELVSRIKLTELKKIVEHKTLIVPQLGATGVSAHEVTRKSGFSVIFGPVRANDIKDFISAGNIATKEMRTVNFTCWDRLVLAPLELVASLKISLVVLGVMFLLNFFAVRPFGLNDFLAYISAVLAGTVLTPFLLPFIPGKAFAFKGWLLGSICTAFIAYTFGWFSPPYLRLGIGYILALPAYSAFLAMNFTGASTYTSFSGVIKEMKVAVPLISVSLLGGIVLILLKTLGS